MIDSSQATHAAYPNADIAREAREARTSAQPRATIAAVTPDSPAYDAGFEPRCAITSVDGCPVRDIIDWRWLSAEDEIEVGYIDLDGDEGAIVLERDEGEDWGFEFEGLVFDRVIQCRNACTFCFMHQLPRGLRSSLYLRDDDFRLSFLVGTFVTLTNLSAQDEARIIEQRISPLRVSLQASNADVRRRLIGKHAQHGLEAFDRLLDAGIEAHVQIVLVPGENDGDQLEETLSWAYERPGILTVGIVPLGYTKHQTRFTHSFDEPDAARAVLATVEAFQRRAQAERAHAWVYAADEFYCNAYGDAVIDHLPEACVYDDFELFEDGVGIVRTVVDDWRRADVEGIIAQAGARAKEADVSVRMIAGMAQKPFLDALVRESGIDSWFAPLYVQNAFFGGNVDVTGLLVGEDIARAVQSAVQSAASEAAGAPDAPGQTIFAIPDVVLNDDGVLLDDMTMDALNTAAGARVAVVSCSPYEYFQQIEQLVSAHASRAGEGIDS